MGPLFISVGTVIGPACIGFGAYVFFCVFFLPEQKRQQETKKSLICVIFLPTGENKP